MQSQLEQQIHQLAEISAAKGLLKRHGEAEYAPIKLAFYPLLTTVTFYQYLGRLEQIWQKLFIEAQKHPEFILKVFESIESIDPMVKEMVRIYKKKSGKVDEDSLTLARCDYFIDEKNVAKIIEYNLVSVSMTTHSQNFHSAQQLCDSSSTASYPANQPTQVFVEEVASFYKLKQMKGLFLFITSQTETNVIEQKVIEIGLLKLGVRCKRVTLFDLGENAVIDQHGDLIWKGELISIVYYRTGYQLCDFPKCACSECWWGKQIAELSNATVIPSIAMELINQKRMQAELSKPNVYKQWLTEQQAVILESSLVSIWDFDNMNSENFDNLMQEVKINGVENYIVKPNLEGGGNNLYGEEAIQHLLSLSEADRKMYILMRKIISPSVQNILMSGKVFQTHHCKYQISRYGMIVRINNTLKNSTHGYLIRVKPELQNEGGIMAGVGSIAAWKFIQQ